MGILLYLLYYVQVRVSSSTMKQFHQVSDKNKMPLCNVSFSLKESVTVSVDFLATRLLLVLSLPLEAPLNLLGQSKSSFRSFFL